MREKMFVIGYPDRLVADHGALLESARAADFDVELISPSALSIVIDEGGTRVLVHGEDIVPDVVLPRGVNRPWPFVSQALEIWEALGVRVVPSRRAAELCADKLTTTRVLAAAGVPVLPSIGLAPGPDNVLPHDEIGGFDGTLVAKPARASKGRGVESFESPADAQSSLRATRPLQAGMVDHHVVQPIATGAGIDYRVVVASRHDTTCVVAVTRRVAPPGEFVTNRPGSIVEDVHDPESVVPDVCRVARDAARALGLSFGGVDVIEHGARPVVLEVNSWPGLAAEKRGRQIADALIEVARCAISTGP
ncbi:MAG: ribosomal protein S6--L-glutamate ligase [Actinomycetota bacterium]